MLKDSIPGIQAVYTAMWNFCNCPPEATYGVGAYAVLAVFVVLAYAAGYNRGYYNGACLRSRAPQNGALYCEVYEMWLNGPTHWEEHKIGKKHAKNNARKQCAGL